MEDYLVRETWLTKGEKRVVSEHASFDDAVKALKATKTHALSHELVAKSAGAVRKRGGCK